MTTTSGETAGSVHRNRRFHDIGGCLDTAAPRRRGFAAAMAIFVLGLGALPAQSSNPAKPRVAFVGASVTGGFVAPIIADPDDESMKLAKAFGFAWPRDRVQLRDYSDVMTFTAPSERSSSAITRAIRAKPELVVGVDFLFWFGYGRMRAFGEERVAKARYALQTEGFALLERLEVPVIVGDYPDMTGADPRMLAVAQIPTPTELQELNRRLYEWAEARPNVHVFPLAKWVARVKAGDDSLVYHGREVELSADDMLQTDGLHASKLGVVLLAHRVWLVVDRAMPEKHPLRVGKRELSEWIDAMDLDDALPESENVESGSGKNED